jgi:hypothetical protein
LSRTDYAFPFRVDPASGQAGQSPYAANVEEMVIQILLTAPGSAPTCRISVAGCGNCCSHRIRTHCKRPRN